MTTDRARLLGVVLLLSAVFFVVEALAASAWDGPPYSWVDQAISELGRTDCGSGIAPACSPQHGIFNAMLVGTGLRVLLALGLGWVLLRASASSALAVAAAALVAIHGIGTVLVGLFPLHVIEVGASSDASAGHVLGALTSIGGGILALVALAVVLRGRHPVAAGAAAGLAVVGGVAMFLAMVGGAPFGAVERVAVYAPILWQMFAGLGLLVRPRHGGTMTA